MPASPLPPLRSSLDLERVLEFEFVRATENAALPITLDGVNPGKAKATHDKLRPKRDIQ